MSIIVLPGVFGRPTDSVLFRNHNERKGGLRGFACCVLLSLYLLAQTQTPSAAAEQLRFWLAAYDNRDPRAYSEFLKTHFATGAENLFQDLSLHNQTGPFDLIRIEEQTATKVTALLNGRDSDRIGRFVIEVEAMEPHRILKLQARVIPRPPELALPHLSEAELIAALRGRLDAAVSADTFAGAVLIAKNGQPIFAHAYGLADREQHIPNLLRTRFRMGSMNKMFTAIAVLQLVSAGKLRLDDPIRKYLPDYPNQELASAVTISELLSHTGGTGDFFGPEFDSHRLELRTHEDYIRLFGQRPVRFEPGSRFEYSNYGSLILGAIIDKVSGQGYYEYVHDHVYVRARMTSTGSEPESRTVPERSVGYTEEGGGALHPNTNLLRFAGRLPAADTLPWAICFSLRTRFVRTDYWMPSTRRWRQPEEQRCR